jgi:CheY-like chemotaxis protein
MLLRGITRTLSGLYEVESTTDAREALRWILVQKSYDVILCDLSMPGMTGLDFHRELSGVSPEMASRLVFLTGGAFTPQSREFLERTARYQLGKPFELDKLLTLIEDIVSHSSRR